MTKSPAAENHKTCSARCDALQRLWNTLSAVLMKKIAYDKIARQRMCHIIISWRHTTPVGLLSLLKPHLSFDPLVENICTIRLSLTAAVGRRRKSLWYIETASWSVKCLNLMLSIPRVLERTLRCGGCVCVCVCERERERERDRVYNCAVNSVCVIW